MFKTRSPFYLKYKLSLLCIFKQCYKVKKMDELLELELELEFIVYYFHAHYFLSILRKMTNFRKPRNAFMCVQLCFIHSVGKPPAEYTQGP